MKKLFFFLLLVIMKSFQINLHKKHIPLNSKLILNSQEEYDFHIETLLFLNNQVDIGFRPDYFITFHYRHPSERYSAKKQTKENAFQVGSIFILEK